MARATKADRLALEKVLGPRTTDPHSLLDHPAADIRDAAATLRARLVFLGGDVSQRWHDWWNRIEAGERLQPPECGSDVLLADARWLLALLESKSVKPVNGNDSEPAQTEATKAPVAPVTADRETIIRSLPESIRMAYLAAEYAIAQGADATTDETIHAWLKHHGMEGDYRVPAYDTFTRYLRKAREALGEQKNTPRAGRATGKSVVSISQI